MFLKSAHIEEILASRGMTKTAFSKECGVSRQNISTILRRGTCHPKTAWKLATGLGVPVDEIVFQREVVYR